MTLLAKSVGDRRKPSRRHPVEGRLPEVVAQVVTQRCGPDPRWPGMLGPEFAFPRSRSPPSFRVTGGGAGFSPNIEPE